MEIKLNRKYKTDISTIGEISVNGKFTCFCVEDIERDIKVAGKTAIPKGKYKIIITMSNRFKKPLPLLLDVPNYEGVRIHSGNTALDTEGCILPGLTRSVDFVGKSREACAILFKLIKTALDKKEEVYITIE